MGRKTPASKGILRWILGQLNLDVNGDFLVIIALVRGGAYVVAADDELCPEALVKRLHRLASGWGLMAGGTDFKAYNGAVIGRVPVTRDLRSSGR